MSPTCAFECTSGSRLDAGTAYAVMALAECLGNRVAVAAALYFA